jgi:hypothetical protein
LRNISYLSLVLRRKEGKKLCNVKWASVVPPKKKQKGLGINYIIDKNHGLITLP